MYKMFIHVHNHSLKPDKYKVKTRNNQVWTIPVYLEMTQVSIEGLNLDVPIIPPMAEVICVVKTLVPHALLFPAQKWSE